MKPRGLRLGCRDSRPDRNTGAAARRNRGAHAYPRSWPAIRTGHETPSPSQGQLRGSSSSSVHVWRPSPWTETTASVDSTLGRPYGLGMWTLGLRLIPAVVSVAGPPGIRPRRRSNYSSERFLALPRRCVVGGITGATNCGKDPSTQLAFTSSTCSRMGSMFWRPRMLVGRLRRWRLPWEGGTAV
jgi:hypothetical protein